MLSSRSIMVGTSPKCASACAVQIPDGRNDGMVMSVDQVPAHIAVAGQMKLAHP